MNKNKKICEITHYIVFQKIKNENKPLLWYFCYGKNWGLVPTPNDKKFRQYKLLV